MSKAHRHVLLCWFGLVLLGMAEFGTSFLRFQPPLRLLLLLPSLGMVALVGAVFMRVGHGIPLVRCFAVGSLLWLLLLLGLGSMDPLTRGTYVVHSFIHSR